MHQATRLRHVVALLDLLPPEIRTVGVHEGASYLHPLGRLICCLRLLPPMGQWSECVEGVTTLSAGVKSIVVRGHSLITGGLYTFSCTAWIQI